jgi:hypothetical protein
MTLVVVGFSLAGVFSILHSILAVVRDNFISMRLNTKAITLAY